MTDYRLVSNPQADLDIEAAFQWYEKEQPGLGLEFLNELRTAYDRIVEGPLKYQHLRSGIRRALLRRFPYAVYFAMETNVIVVLPFSMPAEIRRSGSDGQADNMVQSGFLVVINCDPTLLESLADFNFRGAIGEFFGKLNPLLSDA